MLSITIPVYNAEKYLDECVQSLLAQTYKDYEIILVDDGSKDKSVDMCDRYSEKYENVRVIHKENGGVQTARNVGLENSKGDLVAFIDSDDLVDPQAFEIMIKAMERTKADVVACGYRTEYGKIHLGTYSEIPEAKVFVGGKEAAKGISNGLTGFIWNKVIKKSAIGSLRFRDDMPICEDLFFNYQLMLGINKAAVVDLPLYHYRYVAVSLSKSGPITRYMGCLAGMNRLVHWVEVNVPECNGDIRRNFIFWNTKTCEQMLDDYHPDAFEQVQQYVEESKDYIDGCGTRIKILAKGILKSWTSYKLLGSFFITMKKLYVKAVQLKG